MKEIWHHSQLPGSLDEDSCEGYRSISVDTWMTLKQKILLLLEEVVWVDNEEEKEIVDMMSSQFPKETMEMPTEVNSGKVNFSTDSCGAKPVIPALGRWRPEDQEFQTSLGYLMRTCV